MKKIIIAAALLVTAVFASACPGKADNPTEKQPTTAAKSGEVISMDKEMFLKEVFDYESSKEWKYKGDKPAIIDFYAAWCGPCRQVAPILKKLAKEYDGKVLIYKVNVDKQKELAALFNTTSIPFFVFIPMQGEPQFMRGAADEATYRRAIDEFLLKQ